MTNKKVKVFILTTLVVIGFISCNKDKSINNEPSAVVKKYLEFKTRMDAANGNENAKANFLNVIGASMLRGGKSLNFKSLKGDSIFTDTIPPDSSGYWNHWTCAAVTEFDNPDGTHTTIYDYGDNGCDESGSLIKGKVTYIWKVNGNDYYSKVLYDNYYAFGVKTNGFSEYNFTSDGNSYFVYDSTNVVNGIPDSTSNPGIIFYWSGTSTGRDNLSVVYDSGEKYSYTSNTSSKWENSNYTVLEAAYNCTFEPDGYQYTYLVTKPLFTNGECLNTWVPVSGIETIHYKDATETYDFMIDYGNGECDNLAMITENGETSVYDFGDLIFRICGNEMNGFGK